MKDPIYANVKGFQIAGLNYIALMGDKAQQLRSEPDGAKDRA